MPDKKKSRSIVGKLLLKVKGKKHLDVPAPDDAPEPPPTATATATLTPPVIPPPNPDADRILAANLRSIRDSLTPVAQGIDALHYPVLKVTLDRAATGIRAQLATLDALPDVRAKALRLSQVGEAITKLGVALTKTQQQATDLQKAETDLVQALTDANTAITAVNIVPARTPLADLLTALRLEQTTTLASVDATVLLTLPTLVLKATKIKTDAETAKTSITTANTQKTDWCDTPLATLKALLAKASADTRTALRTDLSGAERKAGDVRTKLNAADFAGVTTVSTEVFYACQSITERVDHLERVLKVKTTRDDAVTLLATLKAHTDYDTAFKAQAVIMEGVIGRAKTVVDAGEAADKTALKAMETELGAAERDCRKSQAEYAAYKVSRGNIVKAIDDLKKHAQAKAIAAEIKQIEALLKDADDLGPLAKGGWHRAKIGLAPVPPRCAQVLALADKLEAAAAKLPELTKTLTDDGMDATAAKKVAGLAHKLLVEDSCTPEQALKMAKSAAKFTDEGVEEPDALQSARVKDAVMTDPSVTEEHAHQIGKSVRGRGTATVDDLKCVAEGMKKMSPKALKALNDSGVVTGICRGPVTDMIPELADVTPRGWGSMTWDDVPGCYMGDKKIVCVGTMDDGSGKRKVPGKGEGPIPHGTPDLIGHEAGHAFDAADGGNKRNHALFVAARTRDLTATAPTCLTPGRDDYFMTDVESPTGNQTGMDGALSESFAESFALHFGGLTSKWPNMLAFWQTNPWSV